MSILCSMVGATFGVAAVAEILRSKKGITAVGNAQVSTAQSKFGGSSALFDGTGDYLQMDSFGTVAESAQDFTIEFWVYWTSLTGGQGLVSDRPPTTSGYGATNFYLEKNSSNTIFFGYSGNGDITGTSSVAANTWYHIAIVRNSGTTKFYLNGTTSGNTLSYTGVVGDGTLSIGAVVGLYMNGYMDEIRISNTARYTANFTAPTEAFVNDANTLLLIHADGTNANTFFEDDNGVRFASRLRGIQSAALSTAQSRFGGSSLIGSNTTNQQVEIDPRAITVLTGPFTIECFFRTTNLTQVNKILIFTSESQAGRRGLHITNQTFRYSISGTDVITTGNFLTSGTWHHIALVRDSGNTTNLYVDGVSRGSYANDTLGFSGSGSSRIFGLAGGFTPEGHIDEFRISKVARYTSAFTPPTQQFVNDADTTLLVHFDGTDGSTVFRDDNGAIPFSTRTAKTLTAQGNAQVDTAQYKYGSSALLCDGNGDYVLASDNADFAFGTSSFTIEYWIRFNAINTLYVPICNRAGTGVGVGDWWCEITAAENKMYWGFRNVAGTTYYVNLALAGTAFATGQWYHIALVNNAGTAQMYVNGTATGATTALSGSFGGGSGGTQGVAVGALGQGSYSVNGWIDEVRISKTARYTANFTPTGPFNSDSNTVLLMHMEGTDASTTFTDDVFGTRIQKSVISISGAEIDTAQSKFGGSSLLMPNDGAKYLTVKHSDDFLTRVRPFCVEGWFRPLSAVDPGDGVGSRFFYFKGINTAGGIGLGISTDGIRFRGPGTDDLVYTGTVSNSTFSHIAFTWDGTNKSIYLNGSRVATTTAHSINVTDLTDIQIGYNSTRFGYNGHIDELRHSNVVRYTGTTYTQPTAAFQNDSNTLLLLHFDGTDASTVFFDDNGIAPYTP